MKWDEKTDVLVIGSGFAGLAAAIEAAKAGASVMVLEKMSAAGGNSIISDGGIAAAGTDFQKKRGIEDTPDLMYRDMMKAGLGINHPNLVRKVTESSNEVLRWTIEELGVPYMDRLDIFGGHSVPRCLTPEGVSGATIIKKQMRMVESLGVSIRYRILFRNFVLDDCGAISGVLVREGFSYKDEKAGNNISIAVNKAVILASGGFGSDIGFRSVQDPRLTADIDTTNKPFATAEALKEALRIHAMPVQLSHIQLGPWGTPDEKGYGDGARFSDYIVFQYGMVIDPVSGKRMVNELADRKTVADAILETGHICIGIADSAAVGTSGWDIGTSIDRDIIRPFSSIAALAAAYGIPADELDGTIERYNGFVISGADADFGKPIMPDAAPISHPPFYAIRTWPKVHYTMGGVQIDEQARVIDVDGHPIPRLYAAGEVTGGVHGACRLGSCAVTDCLVFGRTAGQQAAGEPAR